jgi:lipoate-protein ligase A
MDFNLKPSLRTKEKTSMLIVQSNSMDVYHNLAVEEYLMEHAVDHGPVLFLWQSDCAVVMGKNQNPWRECRLNLMREEKIPVARRISGGGTVYHDAGNLNYCVIVDRRKYREDQAYEMVFQALKSFGIQAERTGKSNLSVDGLKFSGNAFCFRKSRALHHGTLLLNTDLERLNRYLGSTLDRIETHAIASVPAEVGNLNLAVDEISKVLQQSFQELYSETSLIRWSELDLDREKLKLLEEKQGSDEWRFGATPRFSVMWDGLQIEVEKGVVKNVEGEGTSIKVGQAFSKFIFSLF